MKYSRNMTAWPPAAKAKAASWDLENSDMTYDRRVDAIPYKKKTTKRYSIWYHALLAPRKIIMASTLVTNTITKSNVR